jgi:hypothetical protein
MGLGIIAKNECRLWSNPEALHIQGGSSSRPMRYVGIALSGYRSRSFFLRGASSESGFVKIIEEFRALGRFRTPR